MKYWDKISELVHKFTHNELDNKKLDNEFNEALNLLLGDEGNTDIAKALELFEHQRSENLFFIGACHFRLGEHEKAVRYFKKEIKHSSHTTQAVMAAHALSYCHAKGVGVERSRSLSFQYSFMEGQVGGSAKDAYWLALCQIHGLGVAANIQEGMALLRLAARQGDQRAIRKLEKYKERYKNEKN